MSCTNSVSAALKFLIWNWLTIVVLYSVKNGGETRSSTKAKYFESLLQRMQGFELSQPVGRIENKIGRVYLPQTLWQQMKQASCVEIQLPLAARVQLLLQQYPHLVNHPDVLKQSCNYSNRAMVARN